MKATDPARSANMRAIGSRNTKPELAVRAILHKLAPGYRLHRAELPGKPDISYGKRRLAIFVNGCFWHGHNCKHGLRKPKTNADYWVNKIAGNKARDARSRAALRKMGWRSVTVWECKISDTKRLASTLRTSLTRPSSAPQ